MIIQIKSQYQGITNFERKDSQENNLEGRQKQHQDRNGFGQKNQQNRCDAS